MYPFYIPFDKHFIYNQTYEVSRNTEYLKLINDNDYAVNFYSFLSSNIEHIDEKVNARFLTLYFQELSRTITQTLVEADSPDIRNSIESQLEKLITKVEKIGDPQDDPVHGPSPLEDTIFYLRMYLLPKLKNILSLVKEEEIEIMPKKNNISEDSEEMIIDEKPSVAARLLLLEKYGFLEKIYNELNSSGGSIDRPMSRILSYIIQDEPDNILRYVPHNKPNKRPIDNRDSKKLLKKFITDNDIELDLS